jgi:hypothetical protein
MRSWTHTHSSASFLYISALPFVDTFLHMKSLVLFFYICCQTLTCPSLFQDEGHSVDFVLVWTESSAFSCSDVAVKKREVFECHLQEEGLILEREQNLLLHFVKIHAPVEVLGRYAEILKLRMPMKKVTWCS